MNEAGATMAEIVNAVTRVTDIMGEIASGLMNRAADRPVGQAVAERWIVTQQNASLVEVCGRSGRAGKNPRRHA